MSRRVGQTSNATQIEVKDFMFVPTPLTVKPGSTVTWTRMVGTIVVE
jgi:plastocyanin